jgi:hypothetical protein
VIEDIIGGINMCDSSTHLEDHSDLPQKLDHRSGNSEMFVLFAVVRCDCQNGVEFWWGDTLIGTRNPAFGTADDTIGMLDERAKLKGSFIAKATCRHTFELWSETYKTSAGPSYSEFKFEDINRGTGEGYWWWEAHLTKDFRYQIQLWITKDFYWVKLSIGLWYEDTQVGTTVKPLSGDYIQTCWENGCANQAFSRTYQCQPSPSHSPWPTWSRSPNPSPAVSHTPTATAMATVSVAFMASLSALPSDPLIATEGHRRLLCAPLPPRERQSEEPVDEL